jgi:hypothetical protein
MTATHDTAAEGGLSRRSVLGIALTGCLNGLFGTARRGGLAPGGLFANIQSPGYVLAIQGPWRKQR